MVLQRTSNATYPFQWLHNCIQWCNTVRQSVIRQNVLHVSDKDNFFSIYFEVNDWKPFVETLLVKIMCCNSVISNCYSGVFLKLTVQYVIVLHWLS